MSEFSLGETVRALAAQGAAFAALLLAASAAHKMAARPHLQGVVRGFAGVSPSWAAAALIVAAAGEFAAAVLLVLPASRAAGAALAALIWGVYLALILRALWQGRRDVDCGCSFGSARHPLGAFQVARNALLLGLVVAVAAASSLDGTIPIRGSQVLAACGLLALYAAMDQVMALQPLRSGEVS